MGGTSPKLTEVFRLAEVDVVDLSKDVVDDLDTLRRLASERWDELVDTVEGGLGDVIPPENVPQSSAPDARRDKARLLAASTVELDGQGVPHLLIPHLTTVYFMTDAAVKAGDFGGVPDVEFVLPARHGLRMVVVLI